MISTRKVQDLSHFWELIDNFFKASISKELLAEIETFYRIKAENVKAIHYEVQNQPRDNIRLSKQIKAILLEYDYELNPNWPQVN